MVLFNGFQKKTGKTLKKEIEKALKIMNEYFQLKDIESFYIDPLGLVSITDIQ